MFFQGIIKSLLKFYSYPIRIKIQTLLYKLSRMYLSFSEILDIILRKHFSTLFLLKSFNSKVFLEKYVTGKDVLLRKFIIEDKDKWEIINIINSDFKSWENNSIKKANDICKHTFSFLGTTVELGPDINWHKDYISGYEWKKKYHKNLIKINLNDDSDVKFPWELSRFHHGVYLGKAYAFTRDEKYAKEFFSEFYHWVEANPPYIGINWSCAMEVSIRAVNLIWAIFFLKDSKHFNMNIRKIFTESMLIHAKYIYNNFEINKRIINGNLKSVNGNHYIADLVGLLYISLTFQEFKESKKWFTTAYKELMNEILSQVGHDGVHYEYSLNYHRLVLELILSATVYLKKMGIEIPLNILNKIEKMVEFINHYQKQDGSVPLVRDIDNGRLYVLGEEALEDHSYLMSIGAILFERADFTCDGFSEDALWLFGLNGYNKFKNLKINKTQVDSRGFDNSGFFIQRYKKLYIFIICSGVGMYGFCGHTHNDFLSFELYAYDKSFITDGGSFVYSRYPKWRNIFRSTSNHNTVVIDNHEINTIYHNSLFNIGNNVKPKVNLWESSCEKDVLDAEYSIRLCTGDIVKHQRCFFFNKKDYYWVIKDIIDGSGQHKIETFFHFNKNIKISLQNNFILRTVCKDGANLIVVPYCKNHIKLSLIQGWVSSIYGVKNKREVARYLYTGPLPFEITYVLFPLPHFNQEFTGSPEKKSYKDYLIVMEKLDKINIPVL